MLVLIKFLFQSISVGAIGAIVYFNIISIPKNHIGILKERTLGFIQPFLKEGSHWHWSYFVPEKYQLYKINLKPPAQSITFRTGLNYSDYLQLDDVFYAKIKIRVHYTLTPQGSINLLTDFSENVNDWPKFVENRIKNELELNFYNLYDDKEINILKSKLTEYLTLTNKTSFKVRFNKLFASEQIELEKLEILNIYIPDAALYESQVKNINQVFKAKRKALLSKISAQAKVYELQLKNQTEVTQAEKVSSLMKDNPDIIKYLHIYKMNPKAKVIINNHNSSSESINLNGLGLQSEKSKTEPTSSQLKEQEEQNKEQSNGSIAPLTRP